MRLLLTLLSQCALFLFFNPLVSAQCNTSTCTIPVPAVNAQDACILPSQQSLNCYYGQTTPDLPQSFPPTWCTDIDNNHWFAFTATSPFVLFTFSVFGCTSGSGIQAGLLSTTDCITFQTIAACTGIGNVTPQNLFVGGLTIGQVYYLCIDGTDGALCEYSINAQNPAINVVGSSQVCIPTDPSSTYSTPGGASSWSINPPSAGVIVGNPVGSVVTVDWLESGPAQVCAQNVACPNAPLQCVDVLVGGGLTELNVNLCEGKTVNCAGETYDTPGVYEVHFDNGTNCDSTVRCIVHLIPTDTVTQVHTFCPGDSVACAGKYFSSPGVFPVTVQTPLGCDRVVRCQINIIPVDTTTQVVTYCGPATYQVCDTVFAVSGLYSITCTSSLGCDSIVNLDLAILQPNAVLAQQGALSCDTASVVTLYMSSWTQNTAIGGVNLFKWIGPGIVGADNQQTVQVNQPGQYCLILTHGRDSVFCSDTTCVTVLGAGVIPQTPQISGNPNPCANTTDIYTVTPGGLPLPASYTWTTSGNISFSMLSPDSILVNWPDTGALGQICVTANDTCVSSPAACISLHVSPAHYSQTAQICEGETLLLGGFLQNTSGVYVDTLQAMSGCDSILSTTLTVLEVDSVLIFQNTCIQANAGTTTNVLVQVNGCDSVIVTTTVFFPSDSILLFGTSCDPADVGVFTQNLSNQNGCDSTVVTTISFSLADTTLLFSTSCDPANVGVFTQNLSNQNGCDSTVITTVTLLASDTTLLSGMSCDPSDVGIFTQNLSNQNGCDSTVVTTVTLLASDTTLLFGTSCDPSDLGIFTQNLSNQNGCDSTVITTVTLLSSDTTLLFGTSCDPSDLGIFTQNLSNQSGCDSTVITTISLSLPDTTLLFGTSCNPVDVGVFTQNLSNQSGCDSTVITTVTLLSSDTTLLFGTSCDPSDLGLFTQNLSNQNGCDSTIITTISLALSDTTLLFGTSCDPANVGVFTQNLSNQNGCDSTVVTTITFTAPVSNATVNADYHGFAVSCAGEMDGVAQAGVSGGGAPYAFLWSNGSTSAEISGLAAGIYTVTITDANACSSTSSVVLSAPAPLAFSFTVNGLNCFGNQNGAIVVNAQGGATPYRYSLDGNVFQDAPAFNNLDAGAYTVTTADANDCQQTEIILVNAAIPVEVELGDDQTIAQGGSTQLQAIVNWPIDSILSVAWTPPNDELECPNCLEQLVAPFISTTYSVLVTALNGCSGTDNITVTVDRRRYVFVPNVFSPNDDGQNDKFKLFPKPGTVRRFKSFQIFDRWGEQVFAFQDYFTPDDNIGWDGRFKGRDLNPAVFVWVVEVEFVDGVIETFNGNVTLVR